MSVAICNVSKIGIIRQNTFFVSCFISQSYSFLWFSPRKQPSVCQEKNTRDIKAFSKNTTRFPIKIKKKKLIISYELVIISYDSSLTSYVSIIISYD